MFTNVGLLFCKVNDNVVASRFVIKNFYALSDTNREISAKFDRKVVNITNKINIFVFLNDTCCYCSDITLRFLAEFCAISIF